MKQLASRGRFVYSPWQPGSGPVCHFFSAMLFSPKKPSFFRSLGLFSSRCRACFLRHAVYGPNNTQLGHIVPVHSHFQAYILLLFGGLLLRWYCDLGHVCIFAAFASLGFLLSGILPYLALRDPLYFSGCLSLFLFTAYLTGMLFTSLQVSVFVILAGVAYNRLNGWCVFSGLPLLNLSHLQGSALGVAA